MKTMQHKLFGKEANKIFFYFLSKKEQEKPKFRKTKFGYRTYKGDWRFFIDTKKIIKTNYEKVFNGYEYITKTIETVYLVVRNDEKISIKYLYKKSIG